MEKVIWEFNAHLPDEVTHKQEIKVYVRGHYYTFSDVVVNEYLGLKPLSDYEVLAEAEADQASKNELAQFLADDPKRIWTRLDTPVMSPRFAALYIVCGYNWLPTINRTSMNEK